MECSSSTSPPVPALAAEVLFLRKQLAYYRDQQIRPRRLTDPARLSLVSGPGFSTGVKERLHQLENYARTAWVETVENAGPPLGGPSQRKPSLLSLRKANSPGNRAAAQV